MTNGSQPQSNKFSLNFTHFLQASGRCLNLPMQYETSEGMPGRKSPKGCYLSGEHVVYDVNDWIPVEVHSELVVFPSMFFGNQDIPLKVGSQISANKQYIGYCIQSGTIYVYNRQTRQQCLLQGHQQRVTDMAFCGDQVGLLASASSDGYFFIWSIIETSGKEDDQIIRGQISFSIQVLGEWELVHPLVCWLNQDLVVGIDKYVLTLTSEELKKTFVSSGFTVDNPIRCHVRNLIGGIKCAGLHDLEVTALTVISSCPTLIASASRDGTVRIWRDEEPVPVTRFAPYEGLPVGSVSCLSPFENDLHVILTSGESIGSLFQEKAVPLFESLCRKPIESWEILFQERMHKYTTQTQEDLAHHLMMIASSLMDTLTIATANLRYVEEDFRECKNRLMDLMHHNAIYSSRRLVGDSNDRRVNDNHDWTSHTDDFLRLVSEGKLEEAFTIVLSLGDINALLWLLNQVDPLRIFASNPIPLSQYVLLFIMHQLTCNLGEEMPQKLLWIQEAAASIDPNDPAVSYYIRPVLEQVYTCLEMQLIQMSPGSTLVNKMRLTLHVINSLLTSCK